MPRNIEIKARIASVEALLPRAQAVAGGEAELIVQDDTFFTVPQGRLKLREFADGSAELIHYQRPDTGQAKASDYVVVPVPDAAALREALARACGVQGRVRRPSTNKDTGRAPCSAEGVIFFQASARKGYAGALRYRSSERSRRLCTRRRTLAYSSSAMPRRAMTFLLTPARSASWERMTQRAAVVL